MNAPNRPSIILVALNVIGVVAYLILAYPCWIEPGLADIPGASGGAPIIWALTAVPVFVFFFVLDLTWAIILAVSYFRRRRPLIHPVLWLVPVLWAVAIYIDFSHHGG